ncbi:MAG: LPS-assembly protein LptD [Terriglobales bacterium]
MPTEEVTIKAAEQEKLGDVYTLRGNGRFPLVDIIFRDYEIQAREITYNSATGEVQASGHLMFEGGPNDLHLEASHGTYNVRTETGKFYDVVGTTGARVRGKHVLLTSSSPFSFSGKVVEKAGRNRIIVHHGTVTSCTLEDAKWTFNTEKADVVLGQDAKLYHSTFRLEHIPLFYFPFATLPVEKIGRQSGFLIPNVGQSSRKGFILGDSFYWAINRSMDATIGAEYWSHRGWAQHGEFRAKPSDSASVDLKYFGVLDRGFGNPKQEQGGEEATLTGDSMFKLGIRGVADLDYLSSFVFRLAFSETFTQAVNSEVKSTAFLSKAEQGYFFNLMGSRYQNYESTTPGDLITILHAPSFDLGSTDHRLAHSPVVWAYDASAQGVSRHEPDFNTGTLVGRFDLNPRVAVPLHWNGWNFRPELGLRETYYSEQLQPGTTGVGNALSDPINRRAFETSLEIRPPSISKVFEKPILNKKVKHTIEPRLTYRYVNGVDNFNRIIRFDANDILSDTNELEYAVVNRVYAKSNQGEKCTSNDNSELQALPFQAGATECGVGAREVITWEVIQKYFFNETFGGAVVPGMRNVFTTTEALTGIAFLFDYRRFSPIVSRLRIRTGHDTDIEWHLDYDTTRGKINASTALVSKHFGDWFVGGSDAYLEQPAQTAAPVQTGVPTEFNQFRWLIGYGNPNKRGISAAANIGFDVTSRFLQYSAVQTSYNWDCCGFSFEYRRLALGSVRNENQFRFALSLTNLGTFGTLRRQERLF